MEFYVLFFYRCILSNLDLALGSKDISVQDVFANGQKLVDRYSNAKTIIKNGKVQLTSNFQIVLLEKD